MVNLGKYSVVNTQRYIEHIKGYSQLCLVGTVVVFNFSLKCFRFARYISLLYKKQGRIISPDMSRARHSNKLCLVLTPFPSGDLRVNLTFLLNLRNVYLCNEGNFPGNSSNTVLTYASCPTLRTTCLLCNWNFSEKLCSIT